MAEQQSGEDVLAILGTTARPEGHNLLRHCAALTAVSPDCSNRPKYAWPPPRNRRSITANGPTRQSAPDSALTWSTGHGEHADGFDRIKP